MVLIAGGWGRLLKMALICAVCWGTNFSVPGAQPLSSNATSDAGSVSILNADAGHSEDDFTSSSSAADSHSPEDLNIIRHYDRQPPENQAPASAASEGVGRSSLPLSKVTPPAGPQPTALRLFRLIPPTIFENTVEGLDENEKQILADNGRAGPWTLTSMTDDELVFTSSVPHSNTRMRMYLYHAGSGDILIACGVQSGESCALELWRRDAGGRIIPIAIPDEPGISEFLAAGRVLPEDHEVSMLICLDADSARLKAVPMLWTPTGLSDLPLDYDVYYQWNGEAFSKEAVPHAQ